MPSTVSRELRRNASARTFRLEYRSLAPECCTPVVMPPDTDPAALRAADSLAILPDDPPPAAEELQHRREEIGFSSFVFVPTSPTRSLPS
jgi:hypothetical protein